MKRRYFTLIEMMIVIALIGLIGSVVAYNLKGSLDQGKVFKTEQAISQLSDILWLEISKGASFDDLSGQWTSYVKASPLVKDPNKLLVDGWNQPFTIEVNGNDFTIRSVRYDQYKAGHG